MLTALHCASEVTDEEFTLFRVYFNYERPECGDGNGLLNRRRTGVLRLADSDDIQGSNFQGSDFLLVEIEDAMPTSWPVYYAGWDASGSGSGSRRRHSSSVGRHQENQHVYPKHLQRQLWGHLAPTGGSVGSTQKPTTGSQNQARRALICSMRKGSPSEPSLQDCLHAPMEVWGQAQGQTKTITMGR